MKTKVIPVKYSVTGFVECSEAEADYFAVYVFESRPGYGEGWHPAFDSNCEHMYKTREVAEAKLTDTRTANVQY